MKIISRSIAGGVCIATAAMAAVGIPVAGPIVVIVGGLGALAWFVPAVRA